MAGYKGHSKRTERPAPNEEKHAVKPQGIRFTILIAVIVLIYILPRMISFLTTDTMNYVIAKQGAIEQTTTMQGVVTREEQLFTSVSSGVVEYYYPGSKTLSKNTVVCTIRDTSYYGDILDQKLDDVYAEISSVDDNEYASAFAEVESSSYEQIMSYLRMKDNSAYHSVYTLKDSLQSNVQRRQDLFALFSGSQVQKLLEEQAVYQNVVDESSENLWISEAGIIAYSYDGYEGWDASLIDEHYADSYDAQYEYLDINMTQVRPGDPLYRLVTSQNWYITLFVSEEFALKLNGVSSIPFTIHGEDELKGYIYSLQENGHDSYKLVLQVRSHVQDYLDARIVDITINDGSYKGIKLPQNCLVQEQFYRIPLSCVFLSGEHEGVMKRTEEGDHFVIVDFEWKSDEYAYFTLPVELAVGDTLLIQESEDVAVLGEIEDSYGVYVVNGGSKEYQHVELSYQEDGYAIVNGIDAYDHVLILEEEEES